MSENKLAEQILRAYQTLGLRPGQDANKVKQAYRALARALHPDRNPDAQMLMARINDAYNTLCNYLKTQKSLDQSWLMPIARLGRGLGLRFSSWLGPGRPTPTENPAAIELPEEALSQEDHWILLGINQEGSKLVYKVEVCGNPKALALPLRRRRPCRVCQGSGNIWQEGQSNTCGNCGGRGYITKPASLVAPLPEQWYSGQRLSVESDSLSVPLEVELHRSAKTMANIETKV